MRWAGRPFLKRFLPGTAAMVLCILLPGTTLFAMGTSGQAPPEQRAVAAPTPPAPGQQKATIKDILNHPAKFGSSDVVLTGIFKGWTGSCPSSAMLTRSDWILEDDTGCIYVTGRIPAGLAPQQPNNEHIVVTGRVMVNAAGKPYVDVAQKP